MDEVKPSATLAGLTAVVKALPEGAEFEVFIGGKGTHVRRGLFGPDWRRLTDVEEVLFAALGTVQGALAQAQAALDAAHLARELTEKALADANARAEKAEAELHALAPLFKDMVEAVGFPRLSQDEDWWAHIPPRDVVERLISRLGETEAERNTWRERCGRARLAATISDETADVERMLLLQDERPSDEVLAELGLLAALVDDPPKGGAK